MSFEKKMQLVNNIYQNILLNYEDGQDAYDYLISRGFTEETIELFGYGRTVKENAIAKSLMNAESANIDDFIAWGLIHVNNVGEAIDFFKGRLMIPIEDENGRLVGFSGRTLPHNTHPAKYLNSPESDYFKKRTILYNLHRAKEYIRQQDYAILMEGYFDVSLAFQNGFRNVIGTMGTALTMENILNLKRYTNNIVIMFDGDKAGMETALNNAKALIENGFNVKIAFIPNELDPHELILKQGKDAFNHVLVNSYSVFDFTKIYLQNKYNFSIESERMQYVEEMLDAMKHEPFERQSELFVALSNQCGFNFDHGNYYVQQMI